jgi:CRP-like cAMP-binding protein
MWPKGHYVYRKGETANTLFILVSGSIVLENDIRFSSPVRRGSIKVNSPRKKLVEVVKVGEKSMFGENEAFTNQPR